MMAPDVLPDVLAAERRVAVTMDTPQLTADLIVGGTVPRQPAISPDGRWVAYVTAPVGQLGERRLSAVWIAIRNGSPPPRQLTAGTAADSGPRWAPDSTALYFMSDRTGSDQLHRIRIDGGEAEGLTDGVTSMTSARWRTAGSPWWPRTGRLRTSRAGALSAMTPSSGASSAAAEGWGLWT